MNNIYYIPCCVCEAVAYHIVENGEALCDYCNKQNEECKLKR